MPFVPHFGLEMEEEPECESHHRQDRNDNARYGTSTKTEWNGFCNGKFIVLMGCKQSLCHLLTASNCKDVDTISITHRRTGCAVGDAATVLSANKVRIPNRLESTFPISQAVISGRGGNSSTFQLSVPFQCFPYLFVVLVMIAPLLRMYPNPWHIEGAVWARFVGRHTRPHLESRRTSTIPCILSP